ncbi:phosphatase PAP2 family protein [Candidatus Microgenomates bacterium]|nr:phosphatase PAP2 family protein [Candidatus Microgenomates bacterium]
MITRLSLFFLGVFLFASFVSFSYFVHKDFFTQLDFDTTVRLQDNVSARLDNSFSLLSDIGSFEILTVVLLILLFLWRRIRGLLFLFAYVLFHLIELYGKFFVAHAPPPEFMLRTQRIFDFPQFHVRAENSYPSGHVGRTVFLSAILLFLIWRSKRSSAVKIVLASLVIGFDITMAVSRVYLGEHWTSDVIGGALLAGALAVGTYAIAK